MLYADLPDKPGVYMLTHRATGDTYIGSASNIRERVLCHLRQMDRHKHTPKVMRLIELHGRDFEPSVLELTEDCERVRCEANWIAWKNPTLNDKSIKEAQLLKPAKQGTVQVNCRLPTAFIEQIEKYRMEHPLRPSWSQIAEAALREWVARKRAERAAHKPSGERGGDPRLGQRGKR